MRLIANFLKAPTEEAARMKLLRYQLVNRRTGNIINIYRDPQDKQITIWFYEECSDEEFLRMQQANVKPVD